ncbi:MAG: DNA topoisomerase, partial [Mangrovibacterium sp.]
QVKEGKTWKNDAGASKQLRVIQTLFQQCESIIVATDAGREGELIFRYIYDYLNCQKPFERLWISSLTEQAIRKGLEHLQDGSQYDNLYHSAKARSQADWLVGINASQAISVQAGSGVWSLGRVQTPSLAMVCKRFLDHKNHQAQTYFQLQLSTSSEEKIHQMLSVCRHNTLAEAEQAKQKVQTNDFVVTTGIETKEVHQEAPLLFDLTTLQKEANQRYGFSADKTLSVAQSLYEAKLISYPRTGSRYISEDVFAEMKSLIQGLACHSRFGEYAQSLAKKELNKHSVNDQKVSDHHALISTGNEANNLAADQQQIYDLIVGRMLEAFSEKCLMESTCISLDGNGVPFALRASRTLQAGWRAVWAEEAEEEHSLPPIEQGERLKTEGLEVLEKQTKPLSIHTESSLLSAMESCGKELEDEAEREAIKGIGIGTPATRAAIIETLIARNYVVREKKSLVPTDKGLAVYRAVSEKKIADVGMTGEWENKLNLIEAGKLDADSFHREIELYTHQIVSELLETPVASADPLLPCPKCQKKTVRTFAKATKCIDKDCDFILFKTIAGKTLSSSQLNDLLSHGKTSLIKGFKSKTGKGFDAQIMLDKEFKTVFKFR